MTEPRDIEKDKATLERAKGYGVLTGFAFPALEYYITQYEAAEARISELERQLQLKQTKSHTQMLTEAFTVLESRIDGGSYD